MSDTYEQLKAKRLQRAKLAEETGKIAEASYQRQLSPAEHAQHAELLGQVGELSDEIRGLEATYADECRAPAKR